MFRSYNYVKKDLKMICLVNNFLCASKKGLLHLLNNSRKWNIL